MGRLVAGLFALVAAVNLGPMFGVLGVDRLEAAYGVTIADPNLEILMRHRALLFGVVGGLLLGAAFVSELRALAGAMGLFSMLSFVAILLLVGGANDALRVVAGVDLVASLGLAVALVLDRRAGSD